MKRSVILALIAVVAPAVGLNSVAALADGGAQSAAKAVKGKGNPKVCKGKSGGSAVVSAKPGKGKGKKRGCGKATGAALAVGGYRDEAGGVTLSVGSRSAVLTYSARAFCVPFDATSSSFPLKGSGSSVSGSGSTVITPGGVPVSFSWAISINKASLAYTLEVELQAEDPAFAHCRLNDKVAGKLR